MTTAVSFAARGDQRSSFLVRLTDDEDGLENVEIYNLMFTGSSPSANIALGPSTDFDILDEDSE